MDRRSQIKKFFKGQLAEEEAKELLEWLHSAEGESYLSTEVEGIWEASIKTGEYEDFDTKSLWQKVYGNDRIHHKAKAQKSTPGPQKTISFWLKVACSVLFVGAAASIFLRLSSPIETPAPIASEIAEMVTKYNPPGQKTKVYLSDGSTVFLNSDSKIEYAVDFVDNRQIFLEGEAFFTVNKDSLHSFTVVAKGITTTALGTSFNVSIFVEDERVKVTLISGKVKVNKEGKENHLVLSPGEESILSEQEQGFHKRQVDVNKSILWVEGILTFENTPFHEVVKLLERWYGVDIKIMGKTSQSLCSGTFRNNEILDNVLNVLSSSVGFEYQLSGKKITI